MASLLTFSLRMKVRAGNLIRNANEIKQRIALTVDQVLVNETPFDTGRARSNWLAGLKTPRRDIKVGKFGEEPAVVIANAKKRIDRSKPGDIIWISNNIAYINRLNAGSSTQAPAGFVEKAVQVGIAKVRGFKILG